MPDLVAQHTNSEGERISIERVTTGDFAGQLLLVIHDDGMLATRAPTLLDEGMQDWLRRQLDAIGVSEIVPSDASGGSYG